MIRNAVRALSFVGMAFIVASSSTVAPSADEILGDWEKQDDKLPPISLTLAREGGGVLTPRFDAGGPEYLLTKRE